MVLAGAIERVVERQAKVEVERQRIEREPQTRTSSNVASAATIDVTSDATVAALMRKIRTLARQEQFRLGRLR